MNALNKKISSQRLCATVLLLILAGCAARSPAPVSDARPPVDVRAPLSLPSVPAVSAITPGTATAKPIDPSKIHTIVRGDTMFSIAKQYGVDYRELAAWNNIVNPTAIRLGDTLRLTKPDAVPTSTNTAPDNTNQPTTNSTVPLTAGEVITTPLVLTPPIVIEKPLINSATIKVEPKAGKLVYTDQAYAKLLAESGVVGVNPVALSAVPALPVVPPAIAPAPPVPPSAVTVPPAAAAPPTIASDAPNWAWPVKGKITATFTETTKGIDIAGTRGKAVLAAAAGKVIYSEAGLRGYGRMIIIKHNEQWLSAYAHNEKMLVQKDQEIKQGQKIAEMGSSDTDSVKLHFEIRKQGKPVDPMKYLPAQ